MLKPVIFALLVVPSLTSAADVQRGEVLFNLHCAACHGESAVGDGPMAEVLTIPPADLTALADGNDGSFPTERVAAQIDGRAPLTGHGGDMPVYGWFFAEVQKDNDAETPEAILQIIAWLQSVQR